MALAQSGSVTPTSTATAAPTTAGPRPTLAALLKQHRDVQESRRRVNDINRKAVIESMSKVTDSMMDAINFGVARVFSNQKKIEQETKILEAQTSRFLKQTTQWTQMIEDFNEALKETGDIENWSLAIERDMKEITAALDYVHRRNM